MCKFGPNNTLQSLKELEHRIHECPKHYSNIDSLTKNCTDNSLPLESLETLPPMFKRIIGNYTYNKDNEDKFHEELIQGTLQQGSNRSYNPQTKRGSHGFRLETENGEVFI